MSDTEEKNKVEDTPSAVKILVAGDVQGKFKELFTQVGKINKKFGPFACLFCVGNFFDPEGDNDQLSPYQLNQQRIPIPTYFICGDESVEAGATDTIDNLQDGGSICHNLNYLGRSGVKQVSGLTVAYVSGVYEEAKYKNRPASSFTYNSTYHAAEIEHFKQIIKTETSENGIDLLLTTEWGKGFNKMCNDVPMELVNLGSPTIAEIAGECPARYHFASSFNAFFQLPPYLNALHTTRFYGLGQVGNSNKVKAIQALSINCSQSTQEIATSRSAATPNPYKEEEVKEKFETATTQEGKPGPLLCHNSKMASHTEFDDGTWECGFCGNVNRKNQKDKCHMNRCAAPREGAAPRDPNVPRQYGVIAKPEEVVREKVEKRVSLYINQVPTKNKKSKH